MPAFKAADFRLHAEDDDERGATVIGDLVAAKLRASAVPSDVLVLSTTRKGSVGVDALNIRIQEVVNSAAPDRCEMPYRSRVIHEGDRIMQIRNNMRTRSFLNGDFGYLVDMDALKGCAFVAFTGGRGVEMDREALRYTTRTYAVTVHKAQGSDFKHVIAPITTGRYVMLARNIFYTLVSSARERCDLVGT